jgi:hypothetical protein
VGSSSSASIGEPCEINNVGNILLQYTMHITAAMMMNK